ncbi:hypothetical protein TSUD_23670 [Trifolium subterraneum]|uniref:AIPP2-like SPOC-like domain-containing protein n=1 Tax=Trifolium subterraneum TaxID=3900 RepID=A0A2Z6ML39_TRISU|nr:hypothetical protein TSUD_23670 [Trifolium subterraneum]
MQRSNDESHKKVSRRQHTASKCPPPGKVKYLPEDVVINLVSCGEGNKHFTTLPMTRKAITGSSTLSTHASSRREKVAKLFEEQEAQRRRQVEEAKADSDVDMDVGDEEEVDCDDGGMSVHAGEWMFAGPKLDEFPEGPSNKNALSPYEGLDHDASPIAPVTHGKFPRNGVEKNPVTDQHASPVAYGNIIPRNVVHKKSMTDEQTSPTIGQTKPHRHVSDVEVNEPIPDSHENFYHNLKYLPSAIRAWSGQFQIFQGDAFGEFYDVFEAQPPCIVNRKAYNLSNKIPSVLQLESLSALNVLKDVFHDYSPSIEDIALYFFPLHNNERSKKNLNSLMKFMNDKNLMLRSFVDEVQLLVFTSHQLDEDSRGTITAVYEGDFLWGIFRSNQTDVACVRLSDINPIDMMGGNDTDVLEEVGQDITLTQDKPIEKLGPRVRRPPKRLNDYVRDA